MFLKMISTPGEQGEIHIRKCSSEVGSRNAKTSARDESHFQNRMMKRQTEVEDREKTFQSGITSKTSVPTDKNEIILVNFRF